MYKLNIRRKFVSDSTVNHYIFTQKCWTFVPLLCFCDKGYVTADIITMEELNKVLKLDVILTVHRR